MILSSNCSNSTRGTGRLRTDSLCDPSPTTPLRRRQLELTLRLDAFGHRGPCRTHGPGPCRFRSAGRSAVLRQRRVNTRPSILLAHPSAAPTVEPTTNSRQPKSSMAIRIPALRRKRNASTQHRRVSQQGALGHLEIRCPSPIGPPGLRQPTPPHARSRALTNSAREASTATRTGGSRAAAIHDSSAAA